MNLNYTRLLLRITTTFIRYDKKVTSSHFVRRLIPSTITVPSRLFSDEPKELHAVLDEDDFEGEEAFNYANANLEAIAEGNPETLRLLKVYQLEMDFIAQKTGEIPTKITETQWRNLLSIGSKNKRANYLCKLWKRENFKIEKQRLQAEKREEWEKLKPSNQTGRGVLSTNSPINYGLMKTTLFDRIHPTHIKKFYNFKLLQAMMFGPHIIVDCGYDEYMSLNDTKSCVKQIINMWSTNREHLHPFDVIFCNLNTNSILYSRLLEVLPTIKEDPALPFNFTDKNYLDLYPKEQLVYLTPNAPDIMEKYDHNSIYIIGGFVDESKEERLSLAKAKKDGLRMAKFPLDKYLKWAAGRKTLSIPQCLGIMTDLKDGNDWKSAFRHIPSFKIRQFNVSLNDDNGEMKTNVKTSTHLEKRCQQQSAYETLGMRKKTIADSKIEKKCVQPEQRKKFEELGLNNSTAQVLLSTNSPIIYGLGKTTLFYRLNSTQMKNIYNFRLLQTMMFGPHIIVDCGYDEYMSPEDIRSCVKQIFTMWSTNREHLRPFDVIFCNLNTTSILYSKLLDILPAIEEDPAFPFNFTNKNYLDLYPKEQLVYLTPNAPDTMERYDHNSIYVIGGFVDKANDAPLSLAKAKKDGLRMAKFPIDKYSKLGAAKKTLNIPQCFNIMTDLKDGNDWKSVFGRTSIPSFEVKQFNASLNDDNDDNKMKTNLITSRHLEKRNQQQSAYETLGMRKKNRKS